MESESQNARDARVERLWRILDTKSEGALDLNGLKRGLKKMDHPLKNADPLLRDVLKVVDTNGDGRIQYEEFRVFVEETEKELLTLFNSIDRDNNGKLDKEELQTAFSKAGLSVPNSKLDQFFDEVDTNHDGVISFDEWRNFLLFIPSHTPGLKAVMSYYSSTVTMNPEGDVAISDERLRGLGRIPKSPTTFIGVLMGMGSNRRALPVPTSKRKRSVTYSEQPVPFETHPQPGHEIDDPTKAPWPEEPPDSDMTDVAPFIRAIETMDESDANEAELTLVVSPGYFLAGGIAGVISRTATAPLDRLKVYLIAQTGVTPSESVLRAAKSGTATVVAKEVGRPLVEATKALWRAGGIRSMFAGNGLNVIKVMPESAIKFGSFEASKRLLAKLEGHNDPKVIHPTSKFLAGGVGGIVAQFCVYPLDTLKFRMQCETIEGGAHGNALIKQTFAKMWSAQGIRSFYRGLPMGLVGMFPYSAIDLGTFEYLKRAVASRNAKKMGCHEQDAMPGNFMTAMIGGVSGSVGASMVYPLNLLRTRLQSQGTAIHPPTYTGMWDVTTRTITNEGFRGLFRGLTPNLLKVAPAMSISYVVYENSKKLFGLK